MTLLSIHERQLPYANAQKEAVVSIMGYFYAVEFGTDAGPQIHRVGKNRSCSCLLGGGCPAVTVVAKYLKDGGERAPDPPAGYFPSAPDACPICAAPTVSDRRLSSRQRGAGWRCTQGGSLHYWEAHTPILRQKLAANPWLFPPVVLREGVRISAFEGIQQGDTVLYQGVRREDIP